jgi:aspartate-semialdehyde dehydrogenase
MQKIPCGVLGATGMVGQRYISLLENHPWFDLKYVAASERSAGKTNGEAEAGRWKLPSQFGEKTASLRVQVAQDAASAAEEARKGNLRFVFSALEMGKAETAALEESYAAAGVPVVSNASAHRWMDDVPMLVPEVNPQHLEIIPAQMKNHGWKGFIAVKPNCSIQSYMTPVWALIKAGYEVKRLIVTTMQAVSGAGYPGVPSLDMIDNVVPFINGEEEKSEREPLKILGHIDGGHIVPFDGLKISAHCNRVPVSDGHTATVSLEFGEKKPSLDEIKRIWREFRGLPQELKLPSAPSQPILYRDEPDRPQPRLDRMMDTKAPGMAITLGRLRPCNVFDIRFTGLSHNTLRGAAGGGVLNAELLKAKGYFD